MLGSAALRAGFDPDAHNERKKQALMSVVGTTPFESDIAEQPAALMRLVDADTSDLRGVTDRSWERIVVTGMGSSHYAGLPTWRELLGHGRPAWAVDTAQLLDNPGLLTDDTLVIATSQSGASGEVVELLERRAAGAIRTGMVVGIADDTSSPLARQADLFLPLHSGPEATVSTKSYLNTLAVHSRIIAAFTDQTGDTVQRSIAQTAEAVEAAISSHALDELAERTATHPRRRLAYIGRGDEGATALFAALITKESSKVPAEGFIGGEFRHGPFELAGDGLTAVLFASRDSDPGGNLQRLAEELVETSSDVVLVADYAIRGTTRIPNSGDSRLQTLAVGAVTAERFAVPLARANGYTPGAFLHGSKITTAL